KIASAWAYGRTRGLSGGQAVMKAAGEPSASKGFGSLVYRLGQGSTVINGVRDGMKADRLVFVNAHTVVTSRLESGRELATRAQGLLRSRRSGEVARRQNGWSRTSNCGNQRFGTTRSTLGS